MKICKKCNEEKLLDNFGKNSRTRDGLHNWCKKCNVEYNKNHDSPHSRKKWKEENKELNQKLHKEYYEKNKDLFREQSKKWIENNLIQYKYNTYKNSAKKRKIEFSLTKEEFGSFENKPCYYCDEEVKLGIDRLDSNKGYNIENCVSCCPMCNKMKMEFNFDSFINKIKQIYSKHGKV